MTQQNIKKMIGIVVAVIILIIILAFVIKPQSHRPPQTNIDTTDQPTMGNFNARINVIAFEDLKCVACKNFNNNVLPKIKTNYIDKGIAKYTMINVAFIPGSLPAANAARCLYKENPAWFFTYVDNIYKNQPPESENWATIPKLVQFANVIPEVNTEKLSQCIYDAPYSDFIINNFNIARKLQGPTVSTPAIYVNGQYIETPNFDNIHQAIDAAK